MELIKQLEEDRQQLLHQGVRIRDWRSRSNLKAIDDLLGHLRNRSTLPNVKA